MNTFLSVYGHVHEILIYNLKIYYNFLMFTRNSFIVIKQLFGRQLSRNHGCLKLPETSGIKKTKYKQKIRKSCFILINYS